MGLYLQALEEHREEIDSLNVFPVPDGDTGTNLLLTQQAVEHALEALEAEPGADHAAVADTVARAALLAARGNSGVILAQVLAALGEAADGEGTTRGPSFAAALRAAAKKAYEAVAEPKEGTALTVLREAASA